jgi:hypothetical protein
VGAAFLVGVLGLVGSVEAAVKFVTKDVGPYQISYEDDSAKWTINDISFTAGVGTGVGTLKKDVTFLTNDPFIIKFSQKQAPNATSQSSSVGFKVSLDVKLTNKTPNTKWTGFKEELKDFDFAGITTKDIDGMPRGTAFHPLFAHFHPTDTDATKFKKSNPFGAVDPTDFNSKSMFSLSGGEIKNNGGFWTASEYFVHAMDIKGLPRTFNYIETPTAVVIPEPATWPFIVTGVAGLLYCRRKLQATN